jgi:hypothetical protein
MSRPNRKTDQTIGNTGTAQSYTSHKVSRVLRAPCLTKKMRACVYERKENDPRSAKREKWVVMKQHCRNIPAEYFPAAPLLAHTTLEL